ncbi:hypothetical protein [Streptomyces hoynatensis]|uniref:FtsK domain-containing protein n=1 Tax=Streptomyces hoynatensis TaxID=1141874 RepID=A0A3A9YXL9_9ACTN|nr:hypothetical protein [Streptomyces hoynatensis]RKN40788.1 hypothetical protein D7294_17010 [Streptomyces hoynatensis]
MSTEVQPTTVLDVTRVLGRRPGAPFRAAVQATPAGATDASIGTIRQTAPAVEQAADATFRAPAWRRAAAGTWRVVKTAGVGTVTPVRRAWGYQQGGEFTQQIRLNELLITNENDPERKKVLLDEIAQLRAARAAATHDRHREKKTIAGLAGGVFVMTLLILAFVIGPVAPAAAAGAGLGGAYLAGRKEVQQRAKAAELAAAKNAAALEPGGPSKEEVEAAVTAAQEAGVYSPAMLPRGAKPYPISRATTEAEAADCILRALVKEGVPVGDISEVERKPWGWQCVVRVTEGTPGAIIKVTDNLETLFDTAHGSVRPQPMIERRACAKLRIIESDPFASAPPPEYLAPKSISIRDRRRIGSSIDGEELLATLAGVMGEVVAASGGGKTGILQALAEITTACRDAITIDLDPAGDGLEDLGPAARLQGRTHEQIEHVLLWLLILCKARARLRKTLGMGRKWAASAEHPSIVVFIDEYPKLSRLAKKLAWDLLLVGRKEAVPVVFASQGGTTAYLGENIAQMLAMKIVGPCKKVDTAAVFGDGSAAEGWLPHRLAPATDTDPRDAGHVYAQGIPGTQDAPVEYKIHEHAKGMLAKLADERRDAGLLDPDPDSLQAMADVDLPDYVLPEFDVEGNLKKEAPVDLLTWEQLLRLCEADPPAEAITPDTPARQAARKAIAVLDEKGVDRARTEPLAEALGLGPDTLRGLLRELGLEPVQLGAFDGRSNPRGYRLEDLERAI